MFKTHFSIAFCLMVALNATAYAQELPVVTSINPTSGLEWGGTSVVITGTNFQSGATVTFGDREATDVRWRASIAIDAVTPAHFAGAVDVTVTNPDGQVGILENGFTFLPALFEPPIDYAVDKPGGVFCADLDGDGDKDLVLGHSAFHPEYNGTLSVWLNNGDGTFVPGESYGPETGYYGLQGAAFCADLDGDGDNDFACANWKSRNVSVFLNHGDGTFGSKVDYATNDPAGVFSADLDGDGDNDLAVADGLNGGTTVAVFLNRGDGTFAPRVDYVTGSTVNSVFIADLDGDGHNDLAVSNFHSHTVSVLLNHGDGTFAPKVDYDAGRFPRSVFSTDLDGDGDNDLAVANANINKVSVLLNHGDGTFAPKVVYDLLGGNPKSLFIADLDRDGDNDLVVGYDWGNAVSVLLNNGDGTFGGKVDYVTGYSPWALFVADLDGDGDNDLVVDNKKSHTVSVLLNLTDIPTAVAEYQELSSDVPETYFLSQNFPNPFNLSTTIRFKLPEAGVVDLSVYNIYGQRIRKLLGEEQGAGHHSVLWDGKDEAGRGVASGIYLYRLEAGSFIQTRKALLLR